MYFLNDIQKLLFLFACIKHSNTTHIAQVYCHRNLKSQCIGSAISSSTIAVEVYEHEEQTIERKFCVFSSLFCFLPYLMLMLVNLPQNMVIRYIRLIARTLLLVLQLFFFHFFLFIIIVCIYNMYIFLLFNHLLLLLFLFRLKLRAFYNFKFGIVVFFGWNLLFPFLTVSSTKIRGKKI